MAFIELPADAGFSVEAGTGTYYCIDDTEVTQAQYAQFLAAKGSDTSGQTAQCAGNTSYTPSCGATPSGFDPATAPNRPVVCVDWCDAFAFCTWAGKRLCGQIGSGPGGRGWPSQWGYACLNGNLSQDAAASQDPYGEGPVAGECVDSSYQVDGAAPSTPSDVGSAPQCRGGSSPFSEVVDLVGNVAEWNDWVGNTPSTSTPADFGGAFDRPPVTCGGSVDFKGDNSLAFPDVGFRCCAP